MRKQCTECGEDCDIDLRRLAIDLPDWPYTEYEMCWVSACCEADYTFSPEEYDETD